MTIAGSAQVHKSLPVWRHLARAGVVASIAATAVLLTACGGGDQVKKFKPTSIVSFGDESSALVSETLTTTAGSKTVRGLKYGVNAVSYYRNTQVTSPLNEAVAYQQVVTSTAGSTLLATSSQTAWTSYPSTANYSSISVLDVESVSDADTVLLQYQGLSTLATNTSNATVTEAVDINYRYTYSCVDNKLWIQTLASTYGLGYHSQCPNDDATGAVTYAENEATVASTATQVAAHRSELSSNTLVTIMVGQNDVLAAYAQVQASTLTLDSAKANMTAQGAALATIVNDVIKTGARVLLVKMPDLGLSPLALASGQSSANMTALVVAFNNGILNTITNDGTKIGLVNFFDYTRYIKNSPTSYGFTDVVTPICDTAAVYKLDGSSISGARTAPLYGGDPLLYCNSLTHGSYSASTYFWSDEVHLSPGAHSYLGSLAYSRADDNPF